MKTNKWILWRSTSYMGRGVFMPISEELKRPVTKNSSCIQKICFLHANLLLAWSQRLETQSLCLSTYIRKGQPAGQAVPRLINPVFHRPHCLSWPLRPGSMPSLDSTKTGGSWTSGWEEHGDGTLQFSLPWGPVLNMKWPKQKALCPCDFVNSGIKIC